MQHQGLQLYSIQRQFVSSSNSGAFAQRRSLPQCILASSWMCPEAAQGFPVLRPDQKYNVRRVSSPVQSQAEPGSLGVSEMLLKKVLGILAPTPFFLYQSRARAHCPLKSGISSALIDSSDQEEPEQET